MDKQTKKLTILILVLVVIGTGVWYWGASAQSKKQAEQAAATPIKTNIIFFYGQGCPHCADVEKFIADNNIAAKVKYDFVEVWYNQANAKLMMQKAQECGLNQDQIGVPFVYSQGKCYVGTPDVENFFKQAAGIK